MFIQDKIFETMAIQQPADDDVKWRLVHMVKHVIVFAPAEILKGDMEIKDIAGMNTLQFLPKPYNIGLGTSDLNGARYSTTRKQLESASFVVNILKGSLGCAMADMDLLSKGTKDNKFNSLPLL